MAYVTKICEGCGQEFELTPGKNGRVYHAKRYDPSNLIVFASQGDHVYHHSYHLTGKEICKCNCVRLATLTGGDAL